MHVNTANKSSYILTLHKEPIYYTIQDKTGCTIFGMHWTEFQRDKSCIFLV